MVKAAFTTTAILTSALLLPVHLAASEMTQYTHIKPLLLAAIDASDGKASGMLTGPLASLFRTTTGSKCPLLATVTTVGDFSQPGCKRLNLHLQQQGVRTVSDESGNFEVNYGLNLCRNGEAPLQGSELRD
jgi:hypothetical protein